MELNMPILNLYGAEKGRVTTKNKDQVEDWGEGSVYQIISINIELQLLISTGIGTNVDKLTYNLIFNRTWIENSVGGEIDFIVNTGKIIQSPYEKKEGKRERENKEERNEVDERNK